MADQILQEIKDRLNIVDVLGGYIQVKKAGTNFKAVCPFHNEKSASLMISPQKQIWHCFGCGEGGDVFGFVMKFENLEFREAIKLLADKVGVKLPEYRPKDLKAEQEEERLLRINNFAARFYHEILVKDKNSKEALEYLKKRGLTLPTIEQWQIGFAPEGFHTLEEALGKKGVNLNDMVKAGVSAKNERGQIYDRFRGRITFPIFNYNGDVVGFSARILRSDDKAAKYINSPETLVYNKSRVLFGLNFAKNGIRKKDEAVVVEGQMDCITAHQAGFANVVASSGTALTPEQLTMLGRLSKNLKFCFDADTAGQAASKRAGSLALKQGFRLKVIKLHAAKDPDELIKKSPGLWEKAVSEAVWFLDYQMDVAEKNFAGDPVAQKHYLSQEVVPLLSSIQDPLEQDHYVHRLMDKFSISERVIKEQMRRFSSGGPGPQSEPAAQVPVDKGLILEKQLLGAMLAYPEFMEKVLQEGNVTDFGHPDVRALVEVLFQAGKPNPAVQASPVAKEGLFMVESQLEEFAGGREAQIRELNKSYALLKLNAIKREQKALGLAIRQAEQNGQKSQLLELSKHFAELSKERLKFENQT